MADETIKCLACKTDFVWSEREQQFFKNQGLTNKPKRCAPCRQKRREDREKVPQQPQGEE